MTAIQSSHRMVAIKTADTINDIEGVPVSEYARTLSYASAQGNLTSKQMKAALSNYNKERTMQS